MFKIAIAGAGALGGRIGVALKKAGCDVVLIDDWEAHVAQINEAGMHVQTETAQYNIQIPAVLSDDVQGSFDLIIVLTKAMQSEAMLQKLKALGAIQQHTAILSMMNGLGHHERLSQFVPIEQIYLAVTMWTAGLQGPGRILLEGQGAIDFQRADGQHDQRTETILNILNEADLNAHVCSNVYEAIWTKATVNSVLNPLCTIVDKKIGALGSYTYIDEMMTLLIKEIVAVAHAKGINIKYETLLQKIRGTFPKSTQGLHYPSMYQDYKQGRMTEVDYLNGQICAYGKTVGVATPVNEMITHLIHQLEMKNESNT